MANLLNRTKFKNKIYFLMLTVILIFSFVETCNRQVAYHSYDQELYSTNMKIANTYIQYIEAVFDRIGKLTFSLIGDEVVQEKLSFIARYPEDTIPYSVAKEEKLNETLQNSVWNTLIERFISMDSHCLQEICYIAMAQLRIRK